MKFFLITILCLISLNSTADVPNKVWPPLKEKCFPPQHHFAIVATHSEGTNSLYCKLIVGDNSAEYINCTENPIAINSLVLITLGYMETYDKRGNKMCMKIVRLVKVIGKVIPTTQD